MPDGCQFPFNSTPLVKMNCAHVRQRALLRVQQPVERVVFALLTFLAFALCERKSENMDMHEMTVWDACAKIKLLQSECSS